MANSTPVLSILYAADEPGSISHYDALCVQHHRGRMGCLICPNRMVLTLLTAKPEWPRLLSTTHYTSKQLTYMKNWCLRGGAIMMRASSSSSHSCLPSSSAPSPSHHYHNCYPQFHHHGHHHQHFGIKHHHHQHQCPNTTISNFCHTINSLWNDCNLVILTNADILMMTASTVASWPYTVCLPSRYMDS